MFADGSYVLDREGRALSREEMVDLWADWTKRYPIVSIEDAMAEEDWDGWRSVTARLGDRVQLVGDDIFCTNPSRIREGIRQEAANSVLIKVNQIGTLTETLDAMAEARRAGLDVRDISPRARRRTRRSRTWPWRRWPGRSNRHAGAGGAAAVKALRLPAAWSAKPSLGDKSAVCYPRAVY